VNGGILGLITFDHFLQEYLPRQTAISGERLLLGSNLTTGERVLRRLLCQRFWHDGWLGIANLDLARVRHELHAGLAARRLLSRLPHVDVLHFHRQATAYGSLDLMNRVPSIVSIDTTQACVMDAATSALERRSYQPNARLDGMVFRRAAAIVTTSQWTADSVRRMYPDSETPVYVMPDPVLIEYFDAAWIEARRVRAHHGGRPRILFIGGDFHRKGGDDLLAVWRDGGFGARATLELVTSWDLPGDLPPGVSQTRGVKPHSAQWVRGWADADAFVLPTRNEAFGLVFQEAAAAGLPSIGTRHNAIPEIIRDGETGLLISPGDRQALAAALDTLIAAPELRHSMGSRGRAIIEQQASPDHYLTQLTGIILDAARSGRRRRHA
jgi:glycosyltransferase involved in cell wall biosynthesis